MIEIFPTVVPKDKADLVVNAQKNAGFAKRIHIDTDDGILTPALCWPYTSAGRFEVVDLLGIPVDVEAHLMVKDPLAIGEAFARAGAKSIIAQIEAFADMDAARKAEAAFRAAGASEVGLALLFDTPVFAVDPLVELCDVVQLMASPKIGSQGAAFDVHTIDRVRELRAAHPELLISIDIGVSEKTIAVLVKAGATRFAIGSAIAKAPDPRAAYERLMKIAQSTVVQ